MDWRDLGEILEMVMIVCFGISWPLSVYKSYKARTAKGKSFDGKILLCKMRRTAEKWQKKRLMPKRQIQQRR